MNFKNLLVSSAIVLGIISMNSSAIAQSAPTTKELDKKQTKNSLIKDLQLETTFPVRFHQPQKNTVVSHKAAAINSRVIAMSLHEHDGVMYVPSDSLRFYWIGMNHDPDLPRDILEVLIYYPNNVPGLPEIESGIVLTADSVVNYSWDPGPGVYQSFYKHLVTLDEQGNILTSTNLETTDGINWENSYRTLYSYDSQGNKTSEIDQDWSGSVWENDVKLEYTHDSQNNVTEMTRSYWQNTSSSWNKSSRYVLGYEGSNNINSSIYQLWNSTEDSWQNSSRRSVIYTGNNPTQVVSDIWNNQNLQWKPNSKREHTFNANNQMTVNQLMYWDNATEEWLNNEKILYGYDDMGNNISAILQSWGGGSWQYEYKEEYTYSSSNLTELVALDWGGTQFESSARVLYTYNNFQQCTEASIEYYDGNTWAPEIDTPKLRMYYEEFEDGTTGIGTILNQNEFEIYPNPASDILKVKLTGKEIQQIRVVDITGKTVFESRTGFHASEVNIPVNQLQNGVYILQITSGNQTGTKSFVVRH